MAMAFNKGRATNMTATIGMAIDLTPVTGHLPQLQGGTAL